MIADKLLEKAKEAFVLAVEIYNKPTIKYRVEGFTFFICNAWELMLKAYLIKTKGEESIYYKDNPERTINLENCIKLIFTNDKDPLRLNLEKIIELRNTSTHFITEEYEMVYVPLFQSCLFNFSEKMQKFHEVDVTELISLNFLNLVVKEKSLDENEIKAKYSEKIAQKLIGLNDKISKITEESNNSNFAIRIEHVHYITKNKDKATDIIAVDKNADTKAMVIKEIKDPNKTHAFTMKKINKAVNNNLKKLNISLMYKGESKEFNQYYFNMFCDYYDLKNKIEFCYQHKQFKNITYTYSPRIIDFIINEIKKDPENIINNIKERLKQKNKLTPGAKEF